MAIPHSTPASERPPPTGRPRCLQPLAQLWPLFNPLGGITLALVMGAASGYLLIWQPVACSVSQLAPGIDPVGAPVHALPAMVMASFGALTTTGADISQPGHVLASTACLAITIVSQLYVALLIALILGRFHRRGGF